MPDESTDTPVLPVNLTPVLSAALATWLKLSSVMTDGELTVAEAIDVVAVAAHAAAHETGIADKVIATATMPTASSKK